MRASHVLALCVIFCFPPSWAEDTNIDDELDEEFLELLGSFAAEENDWYGFFWSTVEETEGESTVDIVNE